MENFLHRFLLRPFLVRPCFNCGLPPREPLHLLCPSCAKDVSFISPRGRCPRCLNMIKGSEPCGDCSNRDIFWDECSSFLDYQDYIPKELFSRYKFEGSLAAEKDLLGLLAPGLEALRGQNALLIPCGKNTVKTLGFHPVENLLKHFGINISMPFVKTKSAAQKDLSAEERRQRRDFITLDKDYEAPEKVLLIDDVMTTGSTFNEGARLLKERGSKYVHILALLRD